MSTALKSAIMVNIQSHAHTVLEFPQVGIVRLYGNNSNGKSVLVKVLNDVVSNAITKPRTRRSIIRRGNSYGELILHRYDGASLLVHIAVDAATTYAELVYPDSQPVRRYLADKTMPMFVSQFGWHYNSDHDISINIHTDTDGFLFVDTRKRVNFDLLNSVRTDQFAEAAAESIGALLKSSKQLRQNLAHTYEVACATYEALPMWDVEKEQSVRDECLYLAQNLEALDITPMPTVRFHTAIPDVPIVPPMPMVRFCRMTADVPIVPIMPCIRMQKLPAVYIDTLPDIEQSMHNLNAIRNGVCPTCNRRWEENHNEVFERGHDCGGSQGCLSTTGEDASP